MSVKFVKGAALALCGALSLSAGSALAQEAKSLDELLKFVKQGQVLRPRKTGSASSALPMIKPTRPLH